MSIIGDSKFYIQAGTGMKEGTAIPGSGKLYNLVQKNNVFPAMDVDRQSTKTRINKQGNLETVPINTPAINWIDGVPVINSERQATQLLIRPISFGHSAWVKSGATIEGDSTSTDLSTEKIINGTFETNVNSWITTRCSISWNAGKYANCIQNSGASNTFAITQNLLTVGVYYRIKFKAKSPVTTEKPTILTNFWNNIYLKTQPPLSTEWQEYEFYGNPKSISSIIYLCTNAVADGTQVDIDDISIKEVQGFPAPAVDENGDVLMDAYKLVEGSATGTHQLQTPLTFTPGEIRTLSVFAKSSGNNRGLILTFAGVRSAIFNIEEQTLIATNNLAGLSNTLSTKIEPLINGWVKYSVTLEILYTGSNTVRIFLTESASSTTIEYSGDGTSGIYIYNAQLEAGSVATSPVYIDKSLEGAQRTRLLDNITTATDYSAIKTLVINDDAFIIETALPDNGYQLSQLPIKRLIMSESVLSDSQIAALGATKRQLAFSSYVDISAGTEASIRVDGVGYIDWGDGTTSAYSSQVALSHTYTGGYKGLIKFVGTLTYIYTESNLNLYFDLKDLPANLTYFRIWGSNTISGDIAKAPADLTNLLTTGLNTISGDIANAPANLTFLYITGSNQLNIYTVGRTWSNNQNQIYLRQAVGFGLDSTEVDNLLIDLSNVATWVGTTKTIDLQGVNAARTSASDAAVTTLQGKGVTVNTN